METLPAFPRIVQFDIPEISSWPPEMYRHVVVQLSARPSSEWNHAFYAELARSDEDIQEAMLLLDADRISFLALPKNIGTLRRKLRSLIMQIDYRATKARRKARRRDGAHAGGQESGSDEKAGTSQDAVRSKPVA